MPAPSAAAAAEYYPGMYWYSMLTIPPVSDFPGTGEKGNGIPEVMKTQAYWIDTIKNSCQSCHALGSAWIRHGAAGPGAFRQQLPGWARRTQSGQAMLNMALTLGRIGPEKASNCSPTGPTASPPANCPSTKPQRPQGVERNVVVTMWEWSTPKYYLHDAISTDKRNPTVNANGLIYGSPEESTDMVPVLDTIHNKTSFIKHPFIDPNTPSLEDPRRCGPSALWGDEPIWDGHTSIHNPMIDEKGRLWFDRAHPSGRQSGLLQGRLRACPRPRWRR